MLMQGEVQDEKCCFSSPSCFETRPKLKKLLKYSILSISVEQIIQVPLWKTKSLCCELELAHDWHAWSVNRASWDCLHQLIQTGLRQSLEAKHHFFRVVCVCTVTSLDSERHSRKVCVHHLPRWMQAKITVDQAVEGLGGVPRLPSKPSLARPSADTIDLVLCLLSLCLCLTWVML